MSEQIKGRDVLRLAVNDAPTNDQFDALAELFLGDDLPDSPIGTAPAQTDVEPPTAPPPAPPSAPPGAPPTTPSGWVEEKPTPIATPPLPTLESEPLIEVLMLGHLPVRANPWVSQYIRARVDQSGVPAAHIRIDGEHITVRFFAADSINIPTFNGLDDVLRWTSTTCGHWVLQVAELDEPTLATNIEIDCVTLLTGADDAAVVSAYGTIKRLVDASPAAHMWDDDLQPVRIQIATMGSDPETSDAAFARLQRAASVYLGEDINLVARVERMGATGAQHLYEGEFTDPAASIVSRVLDISDARLDPPVMVRESVEATPVVDAPATLTGHVHGLTSLDIECPDDPTVELAVDRDGSMHLLRSDDDGRGLVALVAASGWAMKHLQLLARIADSIVDADAAVDPIMHLFTAEPAACRTLLDGPMRVHLRARVSETWFCTPLN